MAVLFVLLLFPAKYANVKGFITTGSAHTLGGGEAGGSNPVRATFFF